MAEPLLELRDLVVEYPQRRRALRARAVDGVSLTVGEGEIVGLVGESGSGKTSIGAAVAGLAPVTSGSVRYAGEEIAHASAARRRALSAELQVVFQDPYSSLNPVRTIGQTLAEPLLVHRRLRRSEVDAQVRAMLVRVGLDGEAADRYPSQFSGGQRQRIAIARALMISPRLVVCDEAVSALDLSVQAQVLNLLLELQRELSLSYLFISHDLDVVRHMADRIVVVHRGAVVEAGDADRVYDAPEHPYTQALLAAVPLPHPDLQATRRAQRRALRETSGADG